MESKLAYSPDILCSNLPEEFVKLLKYSRKLEFEQEPDYQSIKLMFKNYIVKNGGVMDMEFDWEKPKEDDSKEEEEEDDEKK